MTPHEEAEIARVSIPHLKKLLGDDEIGKSLSLRVFTKDEEGETLSAIILELNFASGYGARSIQSIEGMPSDPELSVDFLRDKVLSAKYALLECLLQAVKEAMKD